MTTEPTLVSPAEERRRREAGHCLVFVRGVGAAGMRVALDVEVLIGRELECAVQLPAEDVSRQHARIVPEGEGHVIVDLDSTNGTFVNDRQIGVRQLVAGDRIRIGPFEARYLRDGSAEAEDLAALSDLSRRDPLTGVANRRAFEETLHRELARARARNAPLAVVALDVDHFKRVNDEHGHGVGDAVLAALAARSARALRDSDLLARIGGEEFVAILPGADLAEAVRVAERIRASVAGSLISASGRSLAITLSAGCAALRDGDDMHALFARADAKLYDAKRSGRNRVRS